MFPRIASTRVSPARAIVLVFGSLLALLTLVGAPRTARAGELADPDLVPVRQLPPRLGPAASASSTANASCAGSACDTVWVGHKRGTYQGVTVGGAWNFDDDVAGTDTTQGWRRWPLAYTSGTTLALTDRPAWAYDYGNMIDEGNTNLENARTLAGRTFVRRGVVGAWHSDPMTNIRKNNNPATNGGELSSVPIDGARSAWCGLRASGDQTAQDALTGNYINGDLYNAPGANSTTRPEFPGYCSLWDQMMYKDFPSTGAGTVTARVRADLMSFIDNAISPQITGWFNPDPTRIANLVGNTSDSMMVYVGSPNESAFDTNRRWFSEVLDFTQPVEELFAYGNKLPVNNDGQAGQDTTLSLPYSGIVPVGGNVRVVFRVKTNRSRADAIVSSSAGVGNTKEGAAVIDDVQVDANPVSTFDNAGDVTARSLIDAGVGIAAAGGPWATTGRPPAAYWHIENLANLLFNDLCGGVTSTVRRCNMVGNVAVPGDFDNGDKLTIEARILWESPTINLAVRSAAPGTKNDQGIDKEAASRPSIVLDYDVYTGFMGLDQSVFWQFGGRFHGPAAVEPVSTNLRCWSPWQIYPGIVFSSDPLCSRGSNGSAADNISSIGIPAGQIDSLRIMVETITQGFRFGGTKLGDTQGTYFDNLRVGFVRTSAPDISQEIWNKYQDQFPVNEGVVPADNAAFDTTTAYVRTGLNIVAPISGPGYVAGDTVLANAPYEGDGVSTGVRMDLVFRIDPGPGNYTVKGDRTSALVEKDSAHPFWSAYIADNGAFGTGGNGVSGPGHVGGVWNKDLWDSCRMDSAELNVWPVVGRNIGGPTSPTWMGAIHELDPKFATLGIVHSLCFLVDPNGTFNQTNISCSGPAPAVYATSANGALPLTTTREGTKIIPDGYLCPGAHVEYFIRRSTLEAPFVTELLFDTTIVTPQAIGTNADYDQERWSSFNVLPDLWKSTRFGGSGLACLLMIDGSDRRGADPAYRSAADTLGYGKTNGAAQGWRVVDPSPTNAAMTTGDGPNNPAGFVAANLGQYGINYDHYDIRAAESSECGHPGARLASVQSPGNADPRRTDRSGPSPAVLGTFYTTVLHSAGDLNSGTLDDKTESQLQADDLTLYDTYLNGASPGNTRDLWLAGDGIQEDATDGRSTADFRNFLLNDFGSGLTARSYKAQNMSARTTTGFLSTAAWAHPGRVYGFDNDCTTLSDVLAVQATAPGAVEAAQYESFAGPGPWTASIYRPVDPATRLYRTLLDGFQLADLQADYASLADVQAAPLANDVARLAWFDDVVTNHFSICARRGGIVAVGDLPGTQGARFANANLGAYPNPAFAAHPVTLRFTLARAQDVTVRIYTVAGREVAHLARAGVAGANAVVWDGALSNGARALPGVYFFAIGGEGLSRDALKPSRMVLLSAR